ncbi:PAS domain-containing protein [Bradyrhizobium japonicum]
MTSPRDNELGARREQGPQALVSLSQLALDHMEQGVCVYDADNRIVLINQSYLSLFDMSADIVHVGTSYREVLAHSAARGNFPQPRSTRCIRSGSRRSQAGSRSARSSNWRADSSWRSS